MTDAVLPELIRNVERLTDLRAKMARLQNRGANRDWVTLMYFREILDAAVHFGTISLEVRQIEKLSAARNRVAHAAADELVESHGDVRKLCRVRCLCMDILLGEETA